MTSSTNTEVNKTCVSSIEKKHIGRKSIPEKITLILKILSNNQTISKNRLSKLVGCNPPSLNQPLQILVELNQIEQIKDPVSNWIVLRKIISD